jgi:hypothetical protein
MGTRGYVVVKLDGKYYKIYNHWDSYPSSLGQIVVNILKSLQLEASKECAYNILNSINKNGCEEIEEQDDPVKIDLFIEWVYTIDLDRKTLTISGGYYEPTYIIDRIPENWFEEFHQENERLSLQDNYTANEAYQFIDR